MNILFVALLGAMIGIPLGYVFQRTNLCFNSAYREVLVHKRTVLLRLIALAVLVQMIGLSLIIQFNIGGVSTSIVPFYWLAIIIGGFTFGLSMVYAEGCSSTVWYRVGNGNLGALVTLIGFAIGEWTLRFGPLVAFREAIQAPQITLSTGAQATLPNALQLNTWIVIMPLALILGLWLFRGKSGSYLGGWDWRKGGLLLGIIGTIAWVIAWPTGWRYGVGVVGATGEFVEMLFQGPGVLNWGSFMLLALPVGAFIAAWRKKELLLQIPNRPSSMRMFFAGLAMGFSATIAWGCNIGHGFTGVPTLALSSFTATIFTFFGASVGNYLRFIRPARIRSSSIEVTGV